MRKGIVIIVIYLLIGLSILPSIGGEYKEEKKNFRPE